MKATRSRAAAAALAAAFCALLCAAEVRAQGAASPGTGQRPPAGVGDHGGGPGRGAGEVDYTRPFRANEVVTRAAITSKPEAGFTEEARLNDTEGIVRLRAVLGSDGQVKNISVVKGLPDGLTERAIAAARSIKFRPAQKDGRAVSQWVTLEYNFNIYYDEDEVERRAVIHEQPQPEYTAEARRHRVEGKVVLHVALSKHGHASAVEVVSGLPHGLTERAVEAVTRLRFTPAADRGRPVSVTRRMEFVFRLD